MEFRILGPLEALDDGRALELGAAKQRALLAILLLHANRVVSSDALIEALWGERPPDTALKALQVYVSGLRKTIGRDRIVTRPTGYELRLDPGELDLDRFQRLVSEGRDEEALTLWRGSPLADFAYEPFAQAEIARLEELRLACLERRLEHDLEAGRDAALVGELEALVRAHPLRERLHAQLMLALYRSGRQAEALQAFQNARRTLVDELGIEPSRSLRELHQQILQQDSALDHDTAVGPELEAKPERLPAPVSARRAERKKVSVVHVRVAVTSERGERLDPEVLRALQTRAFGEITAAFEAHEGMTEAVTGDSVSGVFGLPLVHEDDPLRAVRAADDVRRRLLELVNNLADESAVRLEWRIGVSTGEVMTGESTGAQLRATGEPLTSAARLAQEAAANGVVLDDQTRRAAASRGEESRFTSPMVGRERERRRLHDAFGQAVGNGSCQLFTILGAAGVGKSRLVAECLADLTEGELVARGRCLPYGEGITFWPVLEAIRDVAGLNDTDTPEEVRSQLAALVEDDADAPLVAQRVSEVIGLADASTGIEESFEAVRTFFEALAGRRPLVLVFDDVHWGEETFLDLVEHLADRVRGAPILLLCMARPELLDRRTNWGGGKLNATSVLLEPLSEDECTQLVANLIGEADLADEVKDRIATAAEGNPLFVEETLSMLVDDGRLVRTNGRWEATGDLTSVPVPPTIQALLSARLDQLSSDERRVIEPAAVEGKVFHESSVARLTARDVDVPGALAALARKELVRPQRPVFAGERAFRFRHLMIRDAAYDSITKETRARLHERHVDWLHEKTSERSVEFDEIVGYHLEQAFRYRTELGTLDHETRELGRRAAERLGAAGRRAFLRSDAPAGVNLISRAVALLPPHDPLRVELVPNVRVVQGMSDLSWADRVLTEAVEAAATTGDRRLAAHALVQRGLLRLFTEPDVTSEEIIHTAEQAIAAFEDLEDDLGLARAWRLVAQAHYLGRRLAQCAEASERALSHARVAGDRFEEREIVEWLVIALLLGPTPAPDAIARLERLLDETADFPPVEASILAGLARLLAIQGRLAEADETMGRSKRIIEGTGEWIWIVSFWWAYVYVWRGDPGAAERELRPAYEALKRLGEKSHFSSIAHELSDVVYAQGRYDEAERLTRECEASSRANDVNSQIHWRALRAKAFARRNAFEEAQRLALEAIDLAKTSDFLPAHADALAAFAEVLTLADRRGEAGTVLEEAIHLYERKGDLLAANAARDRLRHAVV